MKIRNIFLVMALSDAVWMHASIVSRRIAPISKISSSVMKATTGISKISAIAPISVNTAGSYTAPVLVKSYNTTSKTTSAINSNTIIPKVEDSAQITELMTIANEKLKILQDIVNKIKTQTTEKVMQPIIKLMDDSTQSFINYYKKIKNPTIQELEVFIRFLDDQINKVEEYVDLEIVNDA